MLWIAMVLQGAMTAWSKVTHHWLLDSQTTVSMNTLAKWHRASSVVMVVLLLAAIGYMQCSTVPATYSSVLIVALKYVNASR